VTDSYRKDIGRTVSCKATRPPGHVHPVCGNGGEQSARFVDVTPCNQPGTRRRFGAGCAPTSPDADTSEHVPEKTWYSRT
jgi:hypothetical protein